MGTIQLRCKVFPGAFLLYLCKPRVAVDNVYEQIVRWGENALEVPPGRRYLRVWFNYITGPTNVAEVVLDVPEGQPVRLVYKTRWLIFLPGKLEIEGAMPQAGMPYGAGAPGMPMAGQPGPGAGQPQHQAHPQAQQQVQAQTHAQAQHQGAGQAPPGWNADPTGRHQHRWWDGQRWTSAVADQGVTADDPL
jgi:Protein of unknown function (DUF2510)